MIIVGIRSETPHQYSLSNSQVREGKYMMVYNDVGGQWVMRRSMVVTALSNCRFVGDRQRESIEPNS